MKFTQPVSMKVTEEQFERDLKQPLLDFGYDICDIGNWNQFPYLVTNYDARHIRCSNSTHSLHKLNNRFFIDHYNPKLFLAIAAMTNQGYGIKGEWWIGIKNRSEQITIGKLYQALKPVNEMNCFTLDNGEEGSNYNRPFKYHRKATLQELITHFSNKESNQKNENPEPMKTITRDQVLELHALSSCIEYREEIKKFLKNQEVLENEYNISNDLLQKALDNGNQRQKELLTKWNLVPSYKIGNYDIKFIGIGVARYIELSQNNKMYFIVKKDLIKIQNTSTISNDDLKCIKKARKLLK